MGDKERDNRWSGKRKDMGHGEDNEGKMMWRVKGKDMGDGEGKEIRRQKKN